MPLKPKLYFFWLLQTYNIQVPYHQEDALMQSMIWIVSNVLTREKPINSAIDLQIIIFESNIIWIINTYYGNICEYWKHLICVLINCFNSCVLYPTKKKLTPAPSLKEARLFPSTMSSSDSTIKVIFIIRAYAHTKYEVIITNCVKFILSYSLQTS